MLHNLKWEEPYEIDILSGMCTWSGVSDMTISNAIWHASFIFKKGTYQKNSMTIHLTTSAKMSYIPLKYTIARNFLLGLSK